MVEMIHLVSVLRYYTAARNDVPTSILLSPDGRIPNIKMAGVCVRCET